MKVGVLGGAGKWGRNIVRTLEGLEGVSVAWVAGSKDDWPGWLTSRRPDAVAIATPASLHAAHAVRVLEQGLPVFVEKPMALSVADAERVRDAAAANHLPVVIDHIHLFNPAWRELKRRLPELGAVREVESEAGQEGPFRGDVTPLWDWGPHDIALAIDLLGGAPSKVECAKTPEGNHRVTMTFGTTVWRAHFGSYFKAKVRRAAVRGAKAEAVWDDVAEVKLRIAGAPAPFQPASPLTTALGEFLSAIGGAPAPSSAALGVDVARVLERCGRGQGA
ncbi:MAG: Gfo/Idh/MocA family oxidoreductase [Candidatus Coatesbacteria bacterium]